MSRGERRLLVLSMIEAARRPLSYAPCSLAVPGMQFTKMDME